MGEHGEEVIDLAQVLRTTMIAGVIEHTASAPALKRRYPNITRAEVALVRQRMIDAARRERQFGFVSSLATMALDYAVPGLGTAARFIQRRSR